MKNPSIKSLVSKGGGGCETHVDIFTRNQWIPARWLVRSSGRRQFQEAVSGQAQAELAGYEEAQATLGKRVNKKVIAMFDKAESDSRLAREATHRLNDRTKIQKVITRWMKRSRRCSWRGKGHQRLWSIFSTLLPGTSAKLEPGGWHRHGRSEVRCSVKWEGGSRARRSRRSWRCRDRPFALQTGADLHFDEVDAALDLSHAHRQNDQATLPILPVPRRGEGGHVNNANAFSAPSLLTVIPPSPGRAGAEG